MSRGANRSMLFAASTRWRGCLSSDLYSATILIQNQATSIFWYGLSQSRAVVGRLSLPRCRRRSKRCSFVMSIYCQRMGFVILTGCNPSSPQKNCCMSRSVDASLEDILQAAWSIELFTAGISSIRIAMSKRNDGLQSEASRSLAKLRIRRSGLDPAFDELVPEARQMIAFRNVLIHDYAVIRDEQVWDTGKNKLPNLKARLATIPAERKAKERAAAQ